MQLRLHPAQNDSPNNPSWHNPLNMKHVLSLDVLQLMALSYPARLLKNKLNEDQHISLLLPFFLRLTSSVLGWRDHVIDLEDHLHHLCGKQDLLLLANQSLKDILLLHVVRANIIAVYAAVGVALLERCSQAYHYDFQIIYLCTARIQYTKTKKNIASDRTSAETTTLGYLTVQVHPLNDTRTRTNVNH